jgi:hypothetical protein
LRNLILAAVAGFVVAVLAALLIQRFDRRVGGVDDMEDILHTRVLADVPSSRRLRWRAGAVGGDDLGPREREAFRMPIFAKIVWKLQYSTNFVEELVSGSTLPASNEGDLFTGIFPAKPHGKLKQRRSSQGGQIEY